MDHFVWLVEKDVLELKKTNTPEANARAAELQQRLEKLQTLTYRRWYADELQRFCQFRLLKTQRETSLSPFLEHARCVRTWQSFDYNLWRACLETPEKPRVAVEAKFLEQVRSGGLVLGWSDQVPWWGLLNSSRTLKKAPVAGTNETKKQGRGPDADEARKFRVTLELRQVLKNYCSNDPDAVPVGLQGKSLLLVGGVHCRLSNISEDGKWLQDESFWIGGEHVQRLKGNSVGTCMLEWRRLRGDPETRHLLERVDIMQQPAAVMDAVIFTWVSEDLCRDYGACVWTRDVCGGGGGSEACTTAMFAAGCVPNYIAAKMTAVLQPTDTDFAFLVKRFAEEAKLEQRTRRNAALAQLGLEHKQAPLHYGALEILTVVDAAVRKLEKRILEENLVLKSLSRNGFLEYRPVKPGTADMRLVKTEGQSWRSSLPGPATSHRLEKAWVSRRWSAVCEKTGVPAVPMKCDGDFQPEAKSVAAPGEVSVETVDSGVLLRGPTEVVSGKKYEQVQCFLGDIDWSNAMELELERLEHAQKSVQARLEELRVNCWSPGAIDTI